MRITLDLDDKLGETILDEKSHSGKTKAEILRESLKWYCQARADCREGYEVHAVKEGSDTKIYIFF